VIDNRPMRFYFGRCFCTANEVQLLSVLLIICMLLILCLPWVLQI